MPELDVRGHSVPTSLEGPTRQGWVLNPLLTVRDPIPVPNTTARAQKIAELADEGIVPSTSNPIFVFRADAGLGLELEYTVDPAGDAWSTFPGTTGWADYTPTLTSSGSGPSLGAGAKRGRFTRIGDTAHGFLSVVFGSGMSAGSGNYVFGLPVPAAADLETNDVLGEAYLLDSGTIRAVGTLILATTPTTAYISPHGNALVVGASAPWTWASGDQIRARFTYQVA